MNDAKRAGDASCPWQGIFPPLVTPLCDRDLLDVAGLERLIEHILDGGVHGLFLLGTTGEAPSLSYRLRREMIERACRQVAGRVPVLVGITDTSPVDSLDLARYAANRGAAAVVMAPPYYFPLEQTELARYARRIATESPLPLFLYNMPMLTGLTFESETVRGLLDCPRILGVKDSSGDLGYFDQLVAIARQRPDWSVLVGPEHLLAETVARGGRGGVHGGANLMPRLFVDLYEAAVQGDAPRVARLQKDVACLGRIYELGTQAAAVIKGLKCALALAGLCADVMAEPLCQFGESEREQIRAILQEFERSRT